mgnify:FL=1
MTWTASVLPLPRGFFGAGSAGLCGGAVVGNVEAAQGGSRVCLWNDGEPWVVDTGASRLQARSARQTTIAGAVRRRSGSLAALLRFGPEGEARVVSLHPRGFLESVAAATDGDTRVGSGRTATSGAALLWPGTGAAPTILPDPGGEGARALGVRDGLVAGAAGWPSRAVLWRGTGEPVSLHPQEAGWSEALGVGDGEQVGLIARTEEAFLAGNVLPVVWRGSAATMTKLLPGGCTAGRAVDVLEGVQVGSVRGGGVERAALWSSTAASHVDLHGLVGGDWTDSAAQSIHRREGALCVLGEVRRMAPDRRGIAARQVVVWTLTSPSREPRSPRS